MLSPLRNRFGIPGVISVIALVFAMMGGAYAAENSGGDASASAKNKRNAKKGKQGGLNAKQKRQVIAIAKRFAGNGPQGPQGVPGLPGAPGADGQNGSNGSNGSDGSDGEDGSDGTSITNTVEPEGTNCAEGGSKFEGTSTTYACNGAEGSPWTAGGTLPEGETLTGAWSFGSTPIFEFSGFEIGKALVPLSFQLRLETAIVPSRALYVDKEEQETETVPADCTVDGVEGSVVNPLAQPGAVCAFEAEFEGELFSPLGENNPSIVAPSTGANGADPAGGILTVFVQNDPNVAGRGTWAVTAPLAP